MQDAETTWPDDTLIIEEELLECILKFKEQLTQLKHCITFLKSSDSKKHVLAASRLGAQR